VLGRVHVADHNEHGVVRRIVPAVVGIELLVSDGLQVNLPTDGLVVVGVHAKGRRRHLLGEHIVRLIL